MTTPIERLRAYLREENVPEGTPYRLFEMTDKEGNERVGVLYCAPEVEQSDEHCPECRDEVLGFGVRLDLEGLDNYLVVSVGPTKYARIESGWRDSHGLDLNDVRFRG